MVVKVRNPDAKSSDKVPAAKKHQTDAKHTTAPVTPTSSSLEEQVIALRARNKILADALQAVDELATEHLKKHFDLVWFARNRNRYPTHKDSKRIQEEHADELSKLRSPEGDYHHGFHCGVLAVSRLYQDHADILHIHNNSDLSEQDFWNKVEEHAEKVQQGKEYFPQHAVDVSRKFPFEVHEQQEQK